MPKDTVRNEPSRHGILALGLLLVRPLEKTSDENKLEQGNFFCILLQSFAVFLPRRSFLLFGLLRMER